MKIWKANEGKVLEVRLKNEAVVKIDPPMGNDLLERIEKTFTEEQVENFFVTRGQFKGPIDIERLDDFVQVQLFIQKQAGVQKLHEIAKQRTPIPGKAELPTPEGPAAIPNHVPRAAIADSYEIPDKIGNVQMRSKRTPYRWIPKAIVEEVWDEMRKGNTVTRQTIQDRPGWEHHYGVLNATLCVLVQRKLLSQPGRGTYQVADPPWSDIKSFLASKGVDITVEDVKEAFWVPTDMARGWLDHLTGSFLKKHATKDTWNILNMPAVATDGKGGRSSEQEAGSVVLPARVPNIGEFSFVKRDITCMDCGHHFGHGYIAGRLEVCMNDYMKRGGSTAHGKGATIEK